MDLDPDPYLWLTDPESDPYLKPTQDPARDPAIYVSDLKDGNLKSYFAYYFLKLCLHHFSKIKSRKEVTKQ
jgi:hypothetical protein